MKQKHVQRCLFFHNWVRNAERVARFVNNVIAVTNKIDQDPRNEDFNVYLNTIQGKTKSNERETIFSDFKKSELGIITSCRTIAEGLDINSVDQSALVDLTPNSIRIVQTSGRALQTFDFVFTTPIAVKEFLGAIDVMALPKTCHFNDTVINCVDDDDVSKDENEDDEKERFELRIIDTERGIMHLVRAALLKFHLNIPPHKQ